MKLKKLQKRHWNFIILLLSIFTYVLFFFSLEKCTEGVDKCCMKFSWIKTKIIEESISCLLTVIIVEIIIIKKLSKLHLIHFICVFISFYFYSNGIDFEDHGYYNIKYYFIIIIFILLLFLLFNYLLSLKKRKIIILFIETFLLIFYLFSNIIYNSKGCEDWKIGLNNTSIDNDKMKYECLIKIPKNCFYKFGKFILDKNRYSPLKCSNNNLKMRNKFLRESKSPFINEKTLHIGFPLINKEEKFFLDIDYSIFRNNVFNNFIDMNNSTLLNLLNGNIPEISVDFSKKLGGKMNVNLMFNQSLSYERKKLENKTDRYSKNVMVIFLDSVSRAYSIRQLKKTLKFIEKFFSYKGNKNNKFPSDNFHSFQFFKYYSHKFYTTGNYPILFYGKHINETNKHINLYFKKNGFITSYTADFCYNDYVRTYHNFSFEDVYDHLYAVCDPNYFGPTPQIHCYYNKYHVEFMFEYINQFWRKYQDNRKFAALLTTFAHEGSLERLKYIDNIIYEFLCRLFNDNLLRETTIFLLSDHGVAIPSIYFLNDFFRYEKVLPMFYLFVNDRKNVSYERQYKYLNQNQQSFITGFDIYNTIIDIIYGDKYDSEEIIGAKSIYGKSLFEEIKQKGRSPKNYTSMDLYACV